MKDNCNLCNSQLNSKMKRSQVNQIIKNSFEYINQLGFKLPKWAFWTKKEWKENKDRCSEIFENQLGWDLTDFGSGDFENSGLLLFTIRNGEKKSYCEKLILLENKQVCPSHFHWKKTEDVINRGGSNLIFQLYNSVKDQEGEYSQENVKVQIDGISHEFKAGELIMLETGQSICLEPYTYHSFWAEDFKGKCLVGEVSKRNDDKTDNRFKVPVQRFAEIEEDEEPIALLAGDYEKFITC